MWGRGLLCDVSNVLFGCWPALGRRQACRAQRKGLPACFRQRHGRSASLGRCLLGFLLASGLACSPVELQLCPTAWHVIAVKHWASRICWRWSS